MRSFSDDLIQIGMLCGVLVHGEGNMCVFSFYGRVVGYGTILSRVWLLQMGLFKFFIWLQR